MKSKSSTFQDKSCENLGNEESGCFKFGQQKPIKFCSDQGALPSTEVVVGAIKREYDGVLAQQVLHLR